jgi:hypothetical protein
MINTTKIEGQIKELFKDQFTDVKVKATAIESNGEYRIDITVGGRE